MADPDRTASLMTPAKLAQIRPKVAASPAAWLSQMAADAGHEHVRRVAELRNHLQALASRREAAPLANELARVAEALPRLDFGLLQSRGWWARATGKSRSAGAGFAAQVEAIDQVAGALEARTREALEKQKDEAAAADRALVELEVEYHAIDKIIDQGARWLQDMRSQIKSREAATDDAPAREALKDDTARCEILVARLKTLRAVSSAAQQAHRSAQAEAGRRIALLQMLQQTLAGSVKAWRARLSELAASARDSSDPALALDGPMEAHRDLQLSIKQAVAGCGQLQAQEKALADSLAELARQLEAA